MATSNPLRGTKGELVCREQKDQADLQRGARELVLQARRAQDRHREKKKKEREEARVLSAERGPGAEREGHTERKKDRNKDRQRHGD